MGLLKRCSCGKDLLRCRCRKTHDVVVVPNGCVSCRMRPAPTQGDVTVTPRARPGTVPAIGDAGLSPKDRADGYVATLCWIAEDGRYVDIHMTAEQIAHLAAVSARRAAREGA